MAVKVLMEFESRSEPVEFITHICGKALRHPRRKVNITADSLGVAPLASFFVAECAQWIDAAVGLATLRSVLAHLRSGKAFVCNSEHSIRDLTEMEQVLSAITGRFRLSFLS